MQRSARGRLTDRRVGWNRYGAESTWRIPPTRQLITNKHMSIHKINKCRFSLQGGILKGRNGPASPTRDRNDGSPHPAQPPHAHGFTSKVIEKEGVRGHLRPGDSR